MKSRTANEKLYKDFYSRSGQVKGLITGTIPLETEMVLHLHYRYEKTLKDVALIIGKSISIVYNHHNRGLYMLEKYLNQQEINNP